MGSARKYIQSSDPDESRVPRSQPDSTLWPPKVHRRGIFDRQRARAEPIPRSSSFNTPLIYAQGKGGGKGPFVFIFDTGRHNIVTPATPRSWASRSKVRCQAPGAGESVMEGGFAKVAQLDVGRRFVEGSTLSSSFRWTSSRYRGHSNARHWWLMRCSAASLRASTTAPRRLR